LNPTKFFSAAIIALAMLKSSLAVTPAEAQLLDARKIWDAGGA
jgi:hypothetical protein